MAMRSPMDDGSTEKFLLKVIEMLGKGFKEKENHNYTADIELSRSAYKVVTTDVEYIAVKALLNLPALVESQNMNVTLKEILDFYKPVLKNLIKSYVSRLECMRAIEDCCLYADHLKEKEKTSDILYHLHQANILNGVSILEFYGQMEERDSPLLRQYSFMGFISWLQDEAAKKLLEDGRKLIESSDDEDDKPLSHWLKRGIQRSVTVKPFCIWMPNPRKQPIKYRPLFIWVNKDGKEIGVEQIQNDLEVDAHEVSQEQNDEKQNEEEAQYEVDDLSEPDDLYDEDDDEPDKLVKDYSELTLEDLPLKFLFKKLTKNYMKGQAHH